MYMTHNTAGDVRSMTHMS